MYHTLGVLFQMAPNPRSTDRGGADGLKRTPIVDQPPLPWSWSESGANRTILGRTLKMKSRGLIRDEPPVGVRPNGNKALQNTDCVTFGEVKMKKFLIAGSSLAAIAAAGSVGAVDVTLGGSIDMGVEFGLGKNEGNLSFGSAYNSVSLSLSAAGTTDHGMKYGASFSIGTAGELEVDAYDTNGADVAGGKQLIKMTVAGATDLEGAVYNVSGGQRISAGSIVGDFLNERTPFVFL